jgi:tetratricopeptide (TPR) repeat protein
LPHQEVIRARVAQEQRNYALALEHFEAAFRLWPNNPWSRYYAAQAAEAMGEFDRAVEQYRYSIRIAPGATDARTRVAQIHWAEDRTGVAIQLLRVKAHEVPLVPEGELLSLELFARTGRHAEIVKNVKIIREGAPPYIGRALARAALGLRDRSGAAAAVEFLRTVGEIDVADLDYAEALRALVQYSVELSEAELVAIDLEAALAANPDAASPRETAAFLLELTGASEEKVRQAYQTVLEIEPENALALAGLGRLSLPGEPERALAYFDRSAASNPDDLTAQLEAARALVALGRSGEAEERLNTLLDEQQFHGRAAALLAELQFERGLSNDRTLDLAKRSVRFGGGVEDLERLARVHEARNEPAESQQASERAKKLGEKQPS